MVRREGNLKVFPGKRLHNLYIFGLYGLIMLMFTMLSPDFLEGYSLGKIIWRNTYVVIMTIGLSFVMAGGWIDFSAGYQISLVSVLAGRLLSAGVHPAIVVLLSLLAGLFCGLLNGFLTAVLGLAPFAATFATQVIFKGISYTISSGSVFSNLPASFRVLTQTKILGIHTDIWIAGLCLLVAAFVFAFTYLGRYIKAIGENEEAVWQSNVNVALVKMICFLISSFFCALAALIMISQYGRATSYNGSGMEIFGITAVYLSGAVKSQASKTGSGYHAWRLVMGVLILETIETGMKLMGWNQFIQYIVMGGILAWAFMRSGYFSRNVRRQYDAGHSLLGRGRRKG